MLISKIQLSEMIENNAVVALHKNKIKIRLRLLKLREIKRTVQIKRENLQNCTDFFLQIYY